MKIKTILLTGGLILLAACSESKYELDQLVPEEYHKILYVNNSGKQEVTLYDTDEDNLFTLSVFKSGSDPTLTANAEIRRLTQEELDAQYSTPEAVNYKIIGDGSYSLDATRLDFSSTDRYKLVNIALTPQKVKADMETDPEAVWVLPLVVTSQTDSINADKNELFLKITGVITPTVGFAKTGVEVKEYSYGTVPSISESVEIGLDVVNKWDLTCGLEVDPEYLAEYNEKNSTVFQSLPEGSYTLPESIDLPIGTTNTSFNVTIDGTALEPGDYMLPVRINSTSLFEISSAKAVHPLTIRIVGPQLDRTGWTGEGTTTEPSEGGGGLVEHMLDGNLSTYWHSRWNGGTDAMPYELTVDTKDEFTFTQFAMVQRGGGFTDTRGGEFYVSSDKNDWIFAGSFTMVQNTDVQMFSVTPTKGRYIKIKIKSSYREVHCSLSEFYAYGLK